MANSSNSNSGNTTDPRAQGKSYGDLSPSKSTQAAAENGKRAGNSSS